MVHKKMNKPHFTISLGEQVIFEIHFMPSLRIGGFRPLCLDLN